MVRGKERLFGLGCECTREVEAGETGDAGEREPSVKGGGGPGRRRVDVFRGGEGRGCEREPDVSQLGCETGGTCSVRWGERVCVGAYGV